MICQPFCCRFATVPRIVSCYTSQFQLSFSCQTGGLTFHFRIIGYREELIDSMTAMCPGPVATKQVQTPPRLCLTVGLRCLFWYAVFGFHQTRFCPLWYKNLHFGLVCLQDIVPEVLCQMQLCKHMLCTFSCNPSKSVTLFQIFPVCTIMEFNN